MAVSTSSSESDASSWGGEHSLDQVPEQARVSTAAHQFWIWTGANIAPINWVLGALGDLARALSLGRRIRVLVLGNLIGHGGVRLLRADGPAHRRQPDGARRGGVRPPRRLPAGRHAGPASPPAGARSTPGSCSTWSSRSSASSASTAATGLKIAIVARDHGASRWSSPPPASGPSPASRRWTVPVTLVVLLAMTVVAWTHTDVHWGYRGRRAARRRPVSAMSTIMTAIGVGWGITWFAYASDYSRFVPADMPRRRLYLASVLGSSCRPSGSASSARRWPRSRRRSTRASWSCSPSACWPSR